MELTCPLIYGMVITGHRHISMGISVFMTSEIKDIMIKKILLVLMLMNLFIQNGFSQNDNKIQWWLDAKFGMFIHWGLYSVPAGVYHGKEIPFTGEWIMNTARIPVAEYMDYAKQFNPVKFNAEEWVKLARNAGMKYIVLTSKHHDGFALFKSSYPFNIVDATPFKRDVVKELAAACKKYNVKFGLYYSQAQDWTAPGATAMSVNWDYDKKQINVVPNPGSNTNFGHWDRAQNGDFGKYIDTKVIPQLHELLSNYGEISVLWFDTPEGMKKEQADKIMEIVKQHPYLIYNNRLGGGYKGDLETPEQFIPATGFPGKNWESCMTMNETWGFKSHDTNWKSSKVLIQNLIDIASKGGNYLLNVGPTSEGVIPEVSQQNLHEIGNWMQLNGEAIYGAKASPFPYLSYGRATVKGQKIYCHVFDWPKNAKLVVPLGNKITKAYLLTNKTQLLKTVTANAVNTIDLPKNSPDTIASVVVIEYEGTPIVTAPPSKGKAVKVIIGTTKIKTDLLTDASPKTQWKAAKGTRTATLEIDLGKEMEINAIGLIEANAADGILLNRKQVHELLYNDGKSWKSVVSVTTNGAGQLKDFTAVKARRFRLIVNNDDGPSLAEWVLYKAN